jgi:hypothetical protein
VLAPLERYEQERALPISDLDLLKPLLSIAVRERAMYLALIATSRKSEVGEFACVSKMEQLPIPIGDTAGPDTFRHGLEIYPAASPKAVGSFSVPVPLLGGPLGFCEGVDRGI